MEEQPKETLELNTITDSLGIVGSALSNESNGEVKVSSQESLESFLKTLVFSTNELVNQLEELNIMQKDMMLDEKRKTAEDISEINAKDINGKRLGLVEPLEGLTQAISDLAKLIEGANFSSGNDIVSAATDAVEDLLEGDDDEGKPDDKGGKRKRGFGAKALEVGKGIGKGLVGLAAGFALDKASEAANESGLTALSTLAAVGSETATGAGIGATVGSVIPVIGTGVGGVIGGGLGLAHSLYENSDQLMEELKGDSFNRSVSNFVDNMKTQVGLPPAATPISESALSSESILVKTEEIDKKESSVQVTDPLVFDQRSGGGVSNSVQSTIEQYSIPGVNEVADPNYYNGGVLEEEMYP